MKLIFNPTGNIEKIILSEKLYPLWRIGWLERAFFLACRKFGRQTAQKLFTDIWKGHDISYYQGLVNFQAMKASGAKFVIPRLGYGVTKDVKFDDYMWDVQGILPNNPYHFYHPELSPVAQADKVLSILDPYQQRIDRVWLDMEYEWTGAYTDSKHWKTYRDGINTVYPTGIYTRATWWDSRVGTLAAEFGRDPFWVAQYSSALTLIPKGAKDVLIWQSGSPTYYAGQTSPRIDYDLWNTDYNFDAEWNTITQPPPQNGETMSNKGTVVRTVRIRNADNTDAGGLLYAGDIVYGEVKLAYGLNRIFYNRIYRKAGNVQTWVGNSALIDGGVTLITTQAGITDPAEVVTPPPPVVVTKPVSVTVSLEGYKPLTLSGEMEPE